MKNLPARQETQVRSLDGLDPGEGSGNPLHYFHLGNPTDGGAWWATVHGLVRVGYDLDGGDKTSWGSC